MARTYRRDGKRSTGDWKVTCRLESRQVPTHSCVVTQARTTGAHYFRSAGGVGVKVLKVMASGVTPMELTSR